MTTSLIFLQAADGNGMLNILMIVAIIAIFYLFMIRPQQKKQKEIRKFRESLKVGDSVVTAGGIYGKIQRVREINFVIEVAKGVNITVDKNSVYPSAEEALRDAESEKKIEN